MRKWIIGFDNVVRTLVMDCTQCTVYVERCNYQRQRWFNITQILIKVNFKYWQ